MGADGKFWSGKFRILLLPNCKIEFSPLFGKRVCYDEHRVHCQWLLEMEISFICSCTG